MPRLSRFFVKSALLCLVLGGAVAGLTLSSAGGLPPALLALRPLVWHLLTVEWATQLIFGVAFWMISHLLAAGRRAMNGWPGWSFGPEQWAGPARAQRAAGGTAPWTCHRSVTAVGCDFAACGDAMIVPRATGFRSACATETTTFSTCVFFRHTCEPRPSAPAATG